MQGQGYWGWIWPDPEMGQVGKQSAIGRTCVVTEAGYAVGKLDRSDSVGGEWLEPESNRRHEDFQSSALPTELSSHQVSP